MLYEHCIVGPSYWPSMQTEYQEHRLIVEGAGT
jgi:hypothetical protein